MVSIGRSLVILSREAFSSDSMGRMKSNYGSVVTMYDTTLSETYTGPYLPDKVVLLYFLRFYGKT